MNYNELCQKAITKVLRTLSSTGETLYIESKTLKDFSLVNGVCTTQYAMYNKYNGITFQVERSVTPELPKEFIYKILYSHGIVDGKDFPDLNNGYIVLDEAFDIPCRYNQGTFLLSQVISGYAKKMQERSEEDKWRQTCIRNINRFIEED